MSERKVALVTAAAGVGIGAAIASQFAADGFDVVVTDAHERRAGEFAEKLSQEFGREFLSLALDVTDFERVADVVKTIVEKRGAVDVLVNNAGWSKIEPLAQMSRETWLRCMDVDLNGTFNCMRHALPYMI
ncbi:MAG: SDR family NAD(P)-dependent oxidoreductase, partial [Halioglobus sp.]|nr:SDR family NAD(P)-dependent oxidoreductase [Halioglobus sp.]